MIRSRSVNLQKIAESLEGLAKTESNYRRIQKIFQNQDIDYEVQVGKQENSNTKERQEIL